MNNQRTRLRWAALLSTLAVCIPLGYTQTDTDNEEDVFELSPFTVDASEDTGYVATSTLAGTRLRSDLKDLGSAISVYTKEFMEDLGAVDNETLLSYTTGTEVGGTYSDYTGVGDSNSLNERGTFNNPNANTRVRGLNSADNTINFFLTDVPWDGYNVDRVDMQRGPNSMLFGLGSPAGIINANTQDAQFNDFNKVELRIGSFGSLRGSFNLNRDIIDDVLAIRVAALSDHRKFEQDPAKDNKERGYVAVKWAPESLNGKRSSFTVKGNFEKGQVRSNRPRVLTPQDFITPFFNPVSEKGSDGTFPLHRGLGQQTFDPFEVRRRASELGDGQFLKKIQPPSTGVEIDNPFYNPAIGNYAQVFGGPLFMWDHPASGLSRVMVTEINQRGGLAPDGSVDDNVSTGFGRLTSVANYINYSQDAGLPFSTFGQYKQPHLTDPTIFDYYNLLIDGPNKEEWSNWEVYNASLAHTFLDNSLGYELSYFEQDYDDGRVGITGFNDRISIDTNSHLTDGTVNPNVGRPFISDSMEGGNQIRDIQRDSFRASAFYRLKFEEMGDNWITRFLGNHTLNGSYSEQSHFADERQFLRYRMEDAYYDMTQVEDGKDNINLVNTTHYIGPSLIGRSSASGAHLSNIRDVQLPVSAPVYFWDATWNAPSSVDPGDPWDGSTQSENPANYVGWTTREFAVLNSLEGDTYNRMINRADLASTDIESEALVWQGFLLNHSIVATYGWREDTVETRQAIAPEFREDSSNNQPLQRLKDVSPGVYNLDFEPNIESGQSRSWSVGVHADRLPFLNKINWPLEVSFYYNEGENFQPGAGRVDMFGHEVAAPFGNTVDKSILIATKDNRYSLKITDYETSVNNANSNYIQGSWFIGRFIAWGENWANIFHHNISNGFTLDGVAKPGDTRTWRYEMKDPTGSVNPEYEAGAVAAWREFVNDVTTNYSDYVTSWKLDGLGTEVKQFNSQDPAGLSYTQNTISRGKEIEFMAQPTPNWRIAMNASKTEAVRNDVGGPAVIEWVALVDSYLKDDPNGPDAGDIRIWSGNGNNIRNMWNSTFRSNYALTELLEGTATPELREWRFNLITNYRFSEGRFKGLAVGGAIRWEDDVIIGYPISTGSDGETTFDLTDPFVGPGSTKLDLNMSFSKKIMNDIRWRIQLNIRNVFADKDLIPITVQPDGTPASVRIPEARTWTITNVFEW